MLGFAFKLLGVGKLLLGWIAVIIKGLFEFATKHPLLTLALLVDAVLLFGCYRGYQAHQEATKRGVEIVTLKAQIKEKDSLIEQLYKRVKEYATALQETQEGRVRDIEEHNKAVQAIKAAGDKQLEEAQRKAEETRAQRDYYFKLSERYRRAGAMCGEPAKRIACEEALNAAFIREMQGVR